jgi:hypothetical protein
MEPLNAKDWLSVVMEEYKSVRQEYLAANQAQLSILSFGMTAIVFIFGTGITLWKEFNLSELFLCLFCPTVILYLNFIHIQIATRTFHTRQLLKEIENKINKIFSNQPDALFWEFYLRRHKQGYNDLPVNQLYIFFSSMFFSIGTAIVHAGVPTKRYDWICVGLMILLFYTFVWGLLLGQLKYFNQQLRN